MKYAIALLLALLVACAPAPRETPDEPVVPSVPDVPETQEPETTVPNPENIEDDAEEFENPLDEAFGEVDLEQAMTESDVICSREERALQIRFRNTGEKTWQLNQDVPFPPPADLAAVRITFNNYEVNGKRDVIIDGEVMFGPEQKFSDNCGGIEELAPGEEISCFLQPVPLRNQNQYGDALQEFYINSPGADGRARFTCD